MSTDSQFFGVSNAVAAGTDALLEAGKLEELPWEKMKFEGGERNLTIKYGRKEIVLPILPSAEKFRGKA